MGYTTIHKLQLYCIFMIAITGIECVFFVVKMKMGEPVTLIQLILIIALFITICAGYNATITRSPKKSLLFFRGIVVVEILELLEFAVSLYLLLATHNAGAHSGMQTLLAWEIFNIVSTGAGAYLGRRVHLHFSSGGYVDFYVDPSVLHANTDYRIPRAADVPAAAPSSESPPSEVTPPDPLLLSLVTEPATNKVEDL
eukprot:TRINITY_DN16810_c0_g1_i1.p1 TRINITY_DN16810_c0_g1~~TRINITY_DN16810_c0_g1_i1.p1  ORF type:complete len:198 (+),score=20.21 TRINITY_DN16810_c0_g1_i1:80-673(+)